MERYRNIDGDSSASEYEIGSDFIRVKFGDGSIYLYTYVSTGMSKVEQMKKLAKAGNGLNSFIGRYVRKAYACKER